MRARRGWRTVGLQVTEQGVQELELELAAVNRCIEQLEKTGTGSEDVQYLVAQALRLAERIDDARWSKPAEALNWLFGADSSKPAPCKLISAGQISPSSSDSPAVLNPCLNGS